MSRLVDKYKSLKEAKVALRNNPLRDLLLEGAIKKHLSDWVVGELLLGKLTAYVKIKNRKAYLITSGEVDYLIFANNNLRKVLSSVSFGSKVKILCIGEYNVEEMKATEFKLIEEDL
jgi:hypothetical protein